MESKNKEYFAAIVNEINVPMCNVYKSGGLYNWGTDNLYPYKLLDVYDKSPTHHSLVLNKVNAIVGQGIRVENQLGLDAYMTDGNQDLTTIVEQLALDLVLFNGFAIKVAQSVAGKYIRIKDLDFSGVRYGTELDEDFCPVNIVYSNDWRNTYLAENKKRIIPLYKNSEPEAVSAFVYRIKPKGGEQYPKPTYESAIASMMSEERIQLFTLRNIDNNYSPTLIMTLKKEMDPDDYRQMKQQLDIKYRGANAAGGILIVAGESPETAPELTPVTPNLQDNVYIEQMKQIQQNIMIAHQVTNPSVAGLPSQGAFSSGEEIRISYDLFDRTVISKMRNVIENSLNTIFAGSSWNMGKISIIPTDYDLENKNDQNQTNDVQTN